MGSTRRGFLGALAGLPVLVPLVRGGDCEAGAARMVPAILRWGDGTWGRTRVPRGAPSRVYGRWCVKERRWGTFARLTTFARPPYAAVYEEV